MYLWMRLHDCGVIYTEHSYDSSSDRCLGRRWVVLQPEGMAGTEPHVCDLDMPENTINQHRSSLQSSWKASLKNANGTKGRTVLPCSSSEECGVVSDRISMARAV